MIPRILHQTWKSCDLPERLRAYQQSWLTQYPDWEYRLWTDEDNLALVERDYPQYRDLYLALPYPILQVDLARILYLHRFGGLYVDLDCESLRSLEPLLAKPSIVLGEEFNGLGKILRGQDYVINALMASPAGHVFWERLLERIAHAFRRKRPLEFREWYIMSICNGPLDQLAREYAAQHDDLVIHPHTAFYPSEPLDRDPKHRRATAEQLHAYAIHHYDNSWFSPGMAAITRLCYWWARYAHRRWKTSSPCRESAPSDIIRPQWVPDDP